MSLSPHVEKPLNSKRWIKVSYLNQFHVFGFLYMFMNIVYFTYPYHWYVTPGGLRNSAWVARTLTIGQDQVGIKPLILKLCSKLERQIWQIPLREYQASLASYSLMCFITLMDSVKTSETAELYLTLTKYCKTFDSTLYTLFGSLIKKKIKTQALSHCSLVSSTKHRHTRLRHCYKSSFKYRYLNLLRQYYQVIGKIQTLCSAKFLILQKWKMKNLNAFLPENRLGLLGHGLHYPFYQTFPDNHIFIQNNNLAANIQAEYIWTKSISLKFKLILIEESVINSSWSGKMNEGIYSSCLSYSISILNISLERCQDCSWILSHQQANCEVIISWHLKPLRLCHR